MNEYLALSDKDKDIVKFCHCPNRPSIINESGSGYKLNYEIVSWIAALELAAFYCQLISVFIGPKYVSRRERLFRDMRT